MVILTLAACGGLATASRGAPSGPKRQALLDSTVRFLQESQQDSGGFAAAGEPSQGTSAWAALALAAAGINPRNQARPCGTDAYSYLVGHFHEATEEEMASAETRVATTVYERELMVVDASGTNPHDFAGTDLVAEILARELPDGSFPYAPGGAGQVNATIFAILALTPVHEPPAEAASTEAAGWLMSQQNDDGSWYWEGRGPRGEVDMTGAAIEALNAAGPSADAGEQAAYERAERAGFAYLEASQLPDGGFPAVPASERESNVASTAWAVQAIWSAGGSPESWRTGSGEASEEPLDYMESMQQPDGHIRWRASSDVNGIWMTSYVAPAFAGQALPIPVAAYSAASAPPCEDASTTANGVIAGGGGNGAPLFSRPKPQSRGRTPGGARLIAAKKRHARDHSPSRRGEDTVQPTGTERAEPTEATGDEVTAVASSAGGTGGSAGEPGLPAVPVRNADQVATVPTGREVSGAVIGSAGSGKGGDLAFAAPGLHSASGDSGEERRTALAIAAAVLLAGLIGAGWERRGRGLPA